jgi:L-ribulose-5-phosphate 3-epimerase
MRLGYNTNGLTCHRWPEALELLAETGYESVAITLDHDCLDPFAPGLAAEVARMRSLLSRLGLESVIETGARFLLDPRQKHEPTLVSPDPGHRARRVEFLKRSIDIARDLGSQCVSFWSGVVRDGALFDSALERLVAGCDEVAEYATRRSMRLAFEPEPGMLISTFADYERLEARVRAPHFGLTIDIGHVHCVEDGPIADFVRAWGPRIFNIHIEDMRKGVHEHLFFGEGEIDFPPVLAALEQVGYTGGLHVELSRHGHMAPEVVRAAYEFLRPRMPTGRQPG